MQNILWHIREFIPNKALASDCFKVGRKGCTEKTIPFFVYTNYIYSIHYYVQTNYYFSTVLQVSVSDCPVPSKKGPGSISD